MKQRLPVILIAVCAAGFVAGILWLFNLRFDAGDVYPEYSSLRADPLGTMAFYESLEKLPGLAVHRDFTTANRLPSENNTTYLHLAGSPYNWDWLPEEFARDIDQFLTRGGRLVIAFQPLNRKPAISSHDWDEEETDSPKDEKKPGAKTDPKKSKKKEKEASRADNSTTNRTSIKQNWDLQFAYDHLKQGDDDIYEPALVIIQTDLPLPEQLEWHSSVVFTNLNPIWHTIYARGTNAVVIERQFGRGSIVMATDSYFLSNEALRNHRHPELLAWIIGDSRNVYFDEAHFGITETSGVAVLIRKYRLHGLIGGLALLAALFIWKNSVSFVPPYVVERQTGFVAGKDAASGFVNLLRRNVPANEMLDTCFAEWRKSCAPTDPHALARMQQVQSVIEAEKTKSRRERDPVGAYCTITRILKKTPGTREAEQ